MALDKQHVLTKKEKAVMHYIFNQAIKSDGVCLIRPVDILQNLSFDLDFEANELDSTLKALELDDFFDVTYSDKKGEFFYCINLHHKGLAFLRVEKAFRSSVRFKVAITALMALLTVSITLGARMILKALGLL